MKKTTLVALSAVLSGSAILASPAITPARATGTGTVADPFEGVGQTDAAGNEAILSGHDGDDVKMFLNDTSHGQTVTSFSGSVTGNGSHSTGSIDVVPNTGVTTASGFATIKPGGSDPLTSILYTPATGVDLDGFFTRAQFEFDGKKNAPASWLVYMTVASSDGTSTFAFKETKLNADVDEFGFDEPALRDGAVVSSVNLFVTANGISFKEVKQEVWSPCDSGSVCGTVVINPTSGVPEPSTWASLLIGFSLMGAFGYFRGKKPLVRVP